VDIIEEEADIYLAFHEGLWRKISKFL
jgi:hypothetical protein